MSDYLGPNQTRVLDSDYRSFEGVVYQKRKPPLSSEATFSNMVSAENSRLDMASIIPSGWLVTGDVKDTSSETSCFTGDVMCSPDFVRNSFKLISTDKGTGRERLIATVNGWHVLVQGSVVSGAMDAWENNQIVLPDTPTVGARVDFVFLEVWRKLITPSDTIYRYGNVNYGGTNFTNDLIDPAANFETSLRIQLQYRIRSTAGIRVEYYTEGFDPLYVFAQGATSTPQNCSLGTFTKMATDPGLWRAGLGNDASKETLGTVDGYVYGIPMFLIRRRNSSAYNPDSNSNGSYYSLSDYLAGTASDRPDGLYNDVAVADDILDIRHIVGASEAYKELCEAGFQKLIAGLYRTKMAKSVLGGENYGPVLVKADAVSVTDLPGSEGMGANGDGIRRIFTNAQMDQPATFVVKTVSTKQSGIQGGPWVVGNTVRILADGPAGSVIQSIDGVQSSELFLNTSLTLTLSNGFTYSATPAAYIDLTVKTLSPLASPVETSYPFTVEYTVRYPHGQNGFRDLPAAFFESGPISRSIYGGNSFALPNNDIPVRSTPPYAVQGSHTLTNQLWSDTSSWNFGHQLVYYPSSPSGPTFTVPRTLFGYDIQGVANVTVNGADATMSAISRTSSTYTVVIGSPATPGTITARLYTGGKFFNVSAQGRGITNTYEMVTMTPANSVDGTNGSGAHPFILDSTDQLMLAYASLSQDFGYGYCYLTPPSGSVGTVKRITDGYHAKNNPVLGTGKLPDSTRTRTTVWFDTPPAAGSTVEVPVLRYSAIQASAGQQFFYKLVPYQGLLDSTSATGCFEATGPAIVTTAGSGSIAAQTTTQKNIIDRLPTLYSYKDGSGDYSPISMSNTSADPTLETHVASRVQDVTDLPSNTAIIGLANADRGRSGVVLPGAPLSGADGYPYLGLKMGKLDTTGSYQKTYQSYLLDKDCSGELYLMVVGSESDNSSASRVFTYYSGNDSVDIFRMPGRPLTLR